MSSKGLSNRIKLSSYDDMFLAENDGNTIAEAKSVEGQIVEIPLSELHTFENHPFRVVDDENMEEMVESVKEYGVLVPAIARPRAEGGYELISGHRRKHASELAGKDTMPVIVRDCDNDEAVVIMVDANIQREDILVSERAKAYQMKYEAMKHQGKAQGNSLQEMSEQAGESMKTIQRLICIASLDEKLLAMVDEKKLGLRQGVDLSFIPQEQQRIVYEVISEMGVSLSQEQSARIKEASRKGYLNADFLRDFLPEKKPKPRKVVFNQKKLDNYFTPDMSNEDIEELIVKLLDEWKEKGEPR
ncbi:ParB/RepB/Spo0J family partition protein [Lachnobacterium bovis]|uniref:ParB/RepB/Spo0J family partition protein n=1 Tax=Lachnobacterium bovis TaxID=140626 RepID=UPI0004844CD9|nr:ParB/RepB/Spo0J family partition protein [Lachnobacterium bovis]